MKIFLGCAALTLAIALTNATADAKGCLKGAAVGGVAGHVAGHHGFIGAAAGCAIGHHEAKKNERTTPSRSRSSHSSDAQPHGSAHCALMPAALMIGHHFSISAF